MTRSEFTPIIQKLLAGSQIPAAFACLRAYLSATPDTDGLNALIIVENRHSRNEQLYTVQRSISLSEYQTEANAISGAVLMLVESLPEDSTVTPAAIEQLLLANNLTKKQVGKILYSIPSQMQIQNPVICTIRIAPEEVYDAILRDGIDEGNATHIEKLQRISEVMKVELREIGTGSFEIIPLTSELEQIIYPNEYTEWLYQVTPLRTGAHTLALEVSVVEILKEYGERRKSVKTLVRKIQVVTTEVPSSAEFEEGEQVDIEVQEKEKSKAAMAAFGAGAKPAQSTIENAQSPIPAPQSVAAKAAVSGAAKGASGGWAGKSMAVATVAAVIVGGAWLLQTGEYSGKSVSPLDNPMEQTQTDVVETEPVSPPASSEKQPPEKAKPPLPKPLPEPRVNPTGTIKPPKDSPTDTKTSNTGKPKDSGGGNNGGWGGNTAKSDDTERVAAQLQNVEIIRRAVPLVEVLDNSSYQSSYALNPQREFVVVFNVSIDKTGRVSDYTGLRADDKALVEACEKVLPAMRFAPAHDDKAAYPSTKKITFTFRLKIPTAFELIRVQ